MSVDPTSIIGEILGEPSAQMRNPVNADYQCPFINSQCLKRSQRIEGPYPVCSIWRNARGDQDRELVCVCPKRFFEVAFLDDVIEHCWQGDPPRSPRIAHEVKMAGFGQVDFVIADIDDNTNEVREFISVELQAVDITGSVEPAYTAVLNHQQLEKRPSHGFNWANVRKRYISQLIAKGFYHHHWGTRMVAVLQTAVYNEFRKYIQFDELEPNQGNVVFMLYDFGTAPENENDSFQLKLDRVVATSHNSLMMGSLYRTPPPKSEFNKKIMEIIRD